MGLAHISKHRREEGITGGVEKFGSYLKRVFPELELYSYTADCDAFKGKMKGKDWECAEKLNEQLLAEGRVGQGTTVITDGYWGRGLAGKVKKIINVVHGSYIAAAWINEFFEYDPSDNLIAHAKIQAEAYREADCVVAVSQCAQEEIWEAYRIPSVKIVNGIDLDVYKPDRRRRRKDLILHVAGIYGYGRKQREMVEGVQGLAPDLRIEYLDVQTADDGDEARRWQEGAVFFQPSLYEGCSYASLEAMACGCVPVAYRTGIWPEVDDRYGVFKADHYVTIYVRALRDALRSQDHYKPREWVEENASLRLFESKWRELVEGRS